MNQRTSESQRGGVVTGLFADPVQGQRALSDLKSAGFNRVEISEAGDGNDAPGSPPANTGARPYDVPQEGRPSAFEMPVAASPPASVNRPFFAEHDSSASSFADELVRLGLSKRDAHDVVEGLVKGAALVTVDGGADMQRAIATLNRYKADIRYAAGASSASGATAVGDAALDEDKEMQLRAERLVVNKERVRHGEARVRKEIVTEMRSIDVPVSREELVIERRAVSGADRADGEPLSDETVRIPLSEERVNVSKETVVREQVEIGKRRIEGTEHISDTVRHEELRVDDPTANKNADR